MIAGEIEHITGQMSDDNYDYFFKKWNEKRKAKKAAKPPKDKEAAKTKRKEFWNKAGEKLQDAGGAEGIGSTIGNVINFFKPGEEPEDYEINVGGDPNNQPQKGIPTEIMIIGGVVLAGALVWGYSVYKKNQAVKTALIQQ